jgi:UDP-N-acetylmuramoylalanine--D-glutamate ligase
MIRGKRITVLGGGLSGRAAASLARDRGAHVVLSDLNPDCPPLAGVENRMGGHPEDILQPDLLVVSPGIPASSAPVIRAKSLGVEVTGELGFAARFLKPETPLVAITGTNGKSTVTSFTGQLFEAAGWKTFMGGNLGCPLSEAVGEEWDVVVVEVSSYQMELPGAFSPSVSAILNLTPDHLTRHGSMENYAAHKFRLLQVTQAEGECVLPRQNDFLDALVGGLGRPSRRLETKSGFLLDCGVAQLPSGDVNLNGLPLPGDLNQWNAATGCLLATLGGLAHSDLRPDSLQALPHRMQVLESPGPLVWINDSKATNIEATMAGVSGLKGPVWLLLGGQGKEGAEYTALRALFDGPVAHVVAFGETGVRIAQAMKGLSCSLVRNLSQAVLEAHADAPAGAKVVLSPACASFDEFNDFTHRGQVFQSLVTAGLGDVTKGRIG